VVKGWGEGGRSVRGDALAGVAVQQLGQAFPPAVHYHRSAWRLNRVTHLMSMSRSYSNLDLNSKRTIEGGRRWVGRGEGGGGCASCAEMRLLGLKCSSLDRRSMASGGACGNMWPRLVTSPEGRVSSISAANGDWMASRSSLVGLPTGNWRAEGRGEDLQRERRRGRGGRGGG